MKTILVPTDFSATALNAAHYAAEMAVSIHADLLLLHVYSIPTVVSEVPLQINVDDMMTDAENELAKLKDELLLKTGDKINIRYKVQMGTFFTELEIACELEEPYAVIMGSQGKTAAERILFGGHTVYAMKHLMWPLITVPPGARFSSLKKIGLACDFEHVVDTTPVDEIKKLIDDFHGELHILNTGKKAEFSPEVIFESALLQEMIGKLKPKYDFITHDDTDEGIMDFAEKNQIDLLIILPRRHGLMDRMIHRSHTKQFVLHCHVPVMALHQASA